MLNFLKKLFGIAEAPQSTNAPYKIEAPAAPVVEAVKEDPAPKATAKKAPKKKTSEKAEKPAEAKPKKPRAKKTVL